MAGKKTNKERRKNEETTLFNKSFKVTIEKFKKLSELERSILSQKAMEVCLNKGVAVPEYEPFLAANCYFSFRYAAEVLKAPFPLGEKAISEHAKWSCWYAKDILKAPFPSGEETISKNAELSCYYATNILRNRFRRGEEAISKNAVAAFRYARDIIRGRWEKGEAAIGKDEWVSLLYATEIRTKLALRAQGVQKPQLKDETSIRQDTMGNKSLKGSSSKRERVKALAFILRYLQSALRWTRDTQSQRQRGQYKRSPYRHSSRYKQMSIVT